MSLFKKLHKCETQRHEARWKVHIQDGWSMLYYPSIEVSIYLMSHYTEA